MELKRPLGLLFTVLLFGLGFTSPSSGATNRDSALQALQVLKSENMTRLEEINELMHKDPSAERVGSLAPLFREHRLRQDFLDRLAFRVESQYRGGPLNTFLQNTLADMAVREAKSPHAKDTSMLRFMSYLAQVIKEDIDKNSDPISTVEAYIKKSGILNPVPPVEYQSSIHYSNGVETYGAKSVDRDKVGLVAEKQINSIESNRTATIKPAFGESRPVLREVMQITTTLEAEGQSPMKADIKDTKAE